MVQVRMLDTLPTAVDGLGLRVETLVEGEVYDVIEGVAERLVGRGAAEVVFPDETPEEAEAAELKPEAELEAEPDAETPEEPEAAELEAEADEAPVAKKATRRRS